MAEIMLPVRLDLLEKGLGDVIDEATGPDVEVHWAKTQPSHESLPSKYVTLDLITGFQAHNQHTTRGIALQPAESIDFTVSSFVEGARYFLRINDWPYHYDAVAGDTEASIAAELIDQINSDGYNSITAASLPGNGFRITADFLGGLRRATYSGPLTNDDVVLATDHVEVYTQEVVGLANCTSFSKERSLRDGAQAISMQCLAALKSGDLLRKLSEHGVAIWQRDSNTDLSEVNNANWERRSSFNFVIAMRAEWVRPIDIIEFVGFQITIFNCAGEVEEVVNVPDEEEEEMPPGPPGPPPGGPGPPG